jgi:hypothetical protein
VVTGLPRQRHDFSAPSKESIHVALLGKVLDGTKDSEAFYTQEEALVMLKRKVKTY